MPRTVLSVPNNDHTSVVLMNGVDSVAFCSQTFEGTNIATVGRKSGQQLSKKVRNSKKCDFKVILFQKSEKIHGSKVWESLSFYTDSTGASHLHLSLIHI